MEIKVEPENWDVNGETVFLNTGSSCFLCLNYEHLFSSGVNNGCSEKCADDITEHCSIKQEPIDEEIYSTEILFPLRSICRHLQIGPEAFTTSLINRDHHYQSTLEISRTNPNMMVTLCTKCKPVARKLSDLCQELELLQMRVDHSLQSFYGILTNSQEEDHFGGQTTEYETAEKLRNEMKKMCNRKLNNVLPKVLIPGKSNTKKPEKFSTGTNHLPVSSKPSVVNVIIHKAKRSLPFPKPKWPSSKHKTCRHCNPPKPVPCKEFKRHQINQHLEHYLISSKQPNYSMPEFKEYCDHIVQMETLSGTKQLDSEENPCVKCPHCSNIYCTHGSLRHHICSGHETILKKRLADLQRRKLEEIRAAELTPSCFSKDDRWKCVACGADFAQVSTLSEHKRKRCKRKDQFGEQPLWIRYKCDVCGEGFRNSFSLVRHRSDEHGMTDENGGNGDRKNERDSLGDVIGTNKVAEIGNSGNEEKVGVSTGDVSNTGIDVMDDMD